MHVIICNSFSYVPPLPTHAYVPQQVPKPAPGAERRIDVKFNDDADDTGRTPARPLPARYVVPLPEGFEEDDSKPAEDDDDEPPPTAPAAAAASGVEGGGEEDGDDPMGEKKECRVSRCLVVEGLSCFSCVRSCFVLGRGGELLHVVGRLVASLRHVTFYGVGGSGGKRGRDPEWWTCYLFSHQSIGRSVSGLVEVVESCPRFFFS